jgi:hypothetical protein
LKVGAGKTLTLSETLTATSGKLSTASTGTIITPTTDGAVLKNILGKATGNITATGEVTIDEEVTVTAGTYLTLNKVTIAGPSGKLDLSELFDPSQNQNKDGAGNILPGSGKQQGKVILKDELVVKDGGTLKISTGNGSDLPPEIDWGQGGSVKIEKDGLIELENGESDITYIGKTSGATLYYWSEGAVEGEYVLLKDGIMEISGKITAGPLPGGYIGSGITATVKGASSEFTVGPFTPDAWYAIDGTLVVENGATFTAKTHIYTYGTLIVEKGANLKLPANATAATLSSVVFVKESGELQVAGTVTAEATDASNTKVGWIELEAATSKLTLLPGGKLDIPAGSSIYTNSGNGTSAPRVSVYAVDANGAVGSVPQIVTDTGTTKAWKLKAGGASGNAVAITDITLGRLKFSTATNTAVNNVTGQAATPGVAGTLEADTGTAVVFTGSEPVAPPAP